MIHSLKGKHWNYDGRASECARYEVRDIKHNTESERDIKPTPTTVIGSWPWLEHPDTDG